MSGEKDDDSVNNFKFLWDRWPVDDRTDILPMMNSVFWPLGEPIRDTKFIHLLLNSLLSV